MRKINVVIYGSTGSIGNSTLSIIRQNKDKINIEGITCNKKYQKLKKIADEFNVKKIGISHDVKNKREYFKGRKIFVGNEFLHEIISAKTDIIIFAISGTQIIDLIIRVLKTGKKIGIANKECIVSLGKQLFKIASKYSSEIVPLDSEHNSIHHLMKINKSSIESVTLTASGGPFRNLTPDQLSKVKLEDALRHPIWKMGKKISIDSATMMNKALEVIEAKYLFNLENDKISAIIHPQSIIHALINYKNGASTALLSEPDMQIPIASLFFSFDKFAKKNNKINLTKLSNLEFFDVDNKLFPSLKLGKQVMEMDGLAPHAFNYLNDFLVSAYLNGIVNFTDIVRLNEINLERIFIKNSNIMEPAVDDIKNINNWIDKNLYLGNQ